MEGKKRLVKMDYLVIGAGFLGAKIVDVFLEKSESVEGTNISGKCFLPLDISNQSQIEALFSKYSPKNVILCASMSNVDECENFPEKAFFVNVKGTENVAKACAKHKAKLAFVSSDYVFDGKKGNYSEEDKTKPIQIYGKTKLLAEKIVLLENTNFVMRVSTLYGWSNVQKKTFESTVIEKLQNAQECMAAVDQITCPTLIDDSANAIHLLFEKDFSGLIHCSGSEAVSRHEFAIKVAKKYSLDQSLVKKIKFDSLDLHAKRPRDSSLDISKLKKLGAKMSSVDKGLEKSKNQKKKIKVFS